MPALGPRFAWTPAPRRGAGYYPRRMVVSAGTIFDGYARLALGALVFLLNRRDRNQNLFFATVLCVANRPPYFT